MSDTEYGILSQASRLVHKHAQAGIAAGGQLCWTFDRKELHISNAAKTSQLPLIGHLPYPVSTQVSVSVSHQDGIGTFAVVATAEGNVAVWSGFESGSQEPLTARVTDDVTCIAAFAATNTSISALLGTKTGNLYLLHCVNTRSAAVSPTLVVSQIQLTEKTRLGSFRLWGQRPQSASRPAAIDLLVHQNAGQLQAFILTESSLECWQMSSAALSASQVPAQQLWSHPVLSSMQQKEPQLKTAQLSLTSLSLTSISTSQQKIAVLAADNNGNLGLQLLSVSSLDAPVVMGTHALTSSASDGGEVSKTNSRWQCCYSKYGEILLHRERGSAYLWRLSEGLTKLDASDSIAGAAAVDNADSPHWLLFAPPALIRKSIRHKPAGKAAAPARPEPVPSRMVPGPTRNSLQPAAKHKQGAAAQTISQEQIWHLLTVAVYTADGDPQREKALQQLRGARLSLLEPLGPANSVAVFSTRVIDVLPKQWGTAAAADFLQQLQDKVVRHQTLLAVLQHIKVLHVLDPQALRVLVESAEKLEAVSAVREYENLQPSEGQQPVMGLLQTVIYAAGQQCGPEAAGTLEQRSEQELFYSCPSSSALAFFDAVSVQVADLDDSPYASNPSIQLQQVVEVVQAVENILKKAHAQHQDLSHAYQADMLRLEPDNPWWSASLPVRTALQTLANTLYRLAGLLHQADQGLFNACLSWLLRVTEAVLSTFTQAMATSQSGATLPALQHDYDQARQLYLQRLLDLAVTQGSSTSLVQSVEQLADAHRAYAQLYDICTLQSDEAKLHSYMQKHRLMLPGNRLDLDRSAAAYVFDRLFQEGQHAQVLSLPEEFNQDLYLWLQRRLAAASDAAVDAALRHLTWLHELRLQKFDAAAGTLQDVTNTKEADVASMRSAACFAKLAKLASIPSPTLTLPPEVISFVSDAHTKIIMLQVQEQLGLGAGHVHDLPDLLQAAVQGEAPVSHAHLALLLLCHVRPVQTQQSYRKEFMDAWATAAAATDWPGLTQPCQQQSDEQTAAIISQTPLCLAAQTCYFSEDHNLREAFPPEDIIAYLHEGVVEPFTIQLMQGAFAHGVHGHYIAEDSQEDYMPVDA